MKPELASTATLKFHTLQNFPDAAKQNPWHSQILSFLVFHRRSSSEVFFTGNLLSFVAKFQ